MDRFDWLQLDVFADRTGAGNPLGVVLAADRLDAARMQAIAAWLNLSETVFFLKPTESGADYRIRIFTPRMELPFAGHPSVGAAWAAIETGLVDPGRTTLLQQCGAGLLPVTIAAEGGQRVSTVRSPPARRIDIETPALPAGLGAIASGDGSLSLWNNGPDWWLFEVSDEASLRSLQPDLAAIAALPRGGKLAAFALADGPGHQVVVRAFAPGAGIPEDPVTGSANALVAASLHRQGRLSGRKARYTASQGRELGRDGKVRVQVDDAGEVWIGGTVQAVIRGTIDW